MAEILIDVKDLTHDEWLTMRSKGIGGSDVGAICGLSKYRSAYATYLSKIGELPKEPESNAAHFGTILEEVVAKEFTRQTGKKVKRNNKMLFHKDYPFMLANLDRMVIGERAFLECKTTSAYNADQWDGDKIPETYMLQIQHYMEVLDYDYCYIACLIGGQKFVWKEIRRDPELIKTMIEIERNFWEEHVLKRIPPAVDGGEADAEILSKLYQESKDNEIPLPATAAETIARYRELKSKATELEEELKNCENYLKDLLGENESGYIDDLKVTWKTIKSNRVDSKILKDKYPDIYKECCYESSCRKFGIKYPKH